MQYLNRRGDIDETAKVKSVCIFNNWTETVPKFCFVVPTYRRARLLNYALDSILNLQGLSDFEVLVTDDNPEREDETEQLMRLQFCKPGIAYYKNERNLGQPGNWNKCFILSRSEWVVMLHDDDLFYPDYFLYLNKCMSYYHNDIGGFFPCYIGSYSNDVIVNRCYSQSYFCARVIKERDFLQGCILGAPLGMCLRRTLVLKIGGVSYESDSALDYDLYNRLSRITSFVKMYDYPLGMWRIGNNISQNPSTPLFCLKWGTFLKLDTFEECGLRLLLPLYKRYIRAFARQHIVNWCKEVNSPIANIEHLPKCSATDVVIFFSFRFYFALVRHLRSGRIMLTIE